MIRCRTVYRRRSSRAGLCRAVAATIIAMRLCGTVTDSAQFHGVARLRPLAHAARQHVLRYGNRFGILGLVGLVKVIYLVAQRT